VTCLQRATTCYMQLVARFKHSMLVRCVCHSLHATNSLCFCSPASSDCLVDPLFAPGEERVETLQVEQLPWPQTVVVQPQQMQGCVQEQARWQSGFQCHYLSSTRKCIASVLCCPRSSGIGSRPRRSSNFVAPQREDLEAAEAFPVSDRC